MYIVSIYSIGLFLSLLCSHHSMVDLLSCLGRYAHTVIQGLVCSYGHIFYSHLLLSNISWYAHMLIYHTFIIPHFHFICLLSFIGRYARLLIYSTHNYGPVCLTLIYWPVSTSAHLFYSYLWASKPLLPFISCMHVCSSILLTFMGQYALTLIYWLVCTSAHLFYSQLWASMPLLSFIGWYTRLPIYSTHSYGWYALISFIGWYARLLIYSTHSYRPVCPYSHLLAGIHVCPSILLTVICRYAFTLIYVSVGQYAHTVIYLLSCIGRYALTLIYGPVCPYCHIFYSHVLAGMPLLKFIFWYALIQIYWLVCPYSNAHTVIYSTLMYWPVCPYSNLLAGMPILKFIGWYALTQIYWLVCPYLNLLAGMPLLKFIGWYALT